MINFELIGGVNFKKGCYPGQEIVARSQYLGKLKRRMMHASVTTQTAAPGTEIFSIDDAGQPCGMVVNAARTNEQEMDCLVEIKLAAAESEIRLGSANGPVLSSKPCRICLPIRFNIPN
jgi:folate-binding Fe-S cluster repair protein YgfZ